MMQAPGAVTERIEVLFPITLEKSRSSCSVQDGIYHPEGSPPALSIAVKCHLWSQSGDGGSQIAHLHVKLVGKHGGERQLCQ